MHDIIARLAVIPMSFRNISNELDASALAELAVLLFRKPQLRVTKRMTQQCGLTGDCSCMYW